MLLDMLNRPIKAGDMALVKGYGSTSYQLARIEKVNRTTVTVILPSRCWQWDAATGRYNYTSNEHKPMRRLPNQCIVVNAQLDSNRNEYPEHCI